jgi:hypothetical protein
MATSIDPSDGQRPEPKAAGTASVGSSGHAVNRSALMGLLLAGTLLAGFASWSLGETGLVRRPAAVAQYNLMGQTIQGQTSETIRAASRQTASRFFAISGGLLVLTAGLAGSLAFRRLRWPLVSGLILPAAWAALCGIVAWFAMPLYDKAADAAYPEMAVSIVAHLMLWVPVGIGAGIALACALGNPKLAATSAVAAAVGVILGVFLFEFIGALLFPLAETGRPLSATPTTRLLAWVVIVLPAVLLGANALLGGSKTELERAAAVKS